MLPTYQESLALFWSVLLELRVEVLIFILAFPVHRLLFKTLSLRIFPLDEPKDRLRCGLHRDNVQGGVGDPETVASSSTLVQGDGESLLASSEIAYENGDHRCVLQLWNTLRLTNNVPATQLAHVVECFQRLRKDSAGIVGEIRAFFGRNRTLCNLEYVNRLLEIVAKSLDTQVVKGIVESMPASRISPDAFTYEVLMMMYFSTRMLADVKALAAEMRSRNITPTPRTKITLLKTSLNQGNFESSLELFRDIWKGGLKDETTASAAPSYLIQQFVELGCAEHRLEAVVDEIEASGVCVESPKACEMMLLECRASGSAELKTRVESLASTNRLCAMQAGTSSFVHGQAHAAQSKVERLLLEVLGFIENQTLCDMVNTVFWSCRRSNAQPEEIVDELYDKLCEIGVTGQRPILSAVVRFHAENSNLEKACDVYEEQAKQRSLFGEGGLVCNLGFHQQIVDMRCERILIDAATKCGRREIVVNLLCCSLCEATRYTSLVRTCATRGDLSVSMNAFKEIHSSGFKLPQHLWNVALSACAELNQIDRVEALIKQMEDDGVADGVTYNTMIKMYMQRDDHVRARGVFAIMQEAGFPPDIITYNEILHGYVKGIARGRNDSSVVWEVISEMSHAGVQPSRVTCSILLRNLKGEDLVRAMDLMESIGEPVDEGLLSAFLEACVRSGRADLISKKLHGLHAEGLVKITSPQAYGSLIKAYGVVKDVDGAWRCWREMLSQHLKPTSVTMGCMIEAVSANGDVDGAYEIVCSLLDDPQTRDQVNCIMFGSVLKGYGRMGRIDRVLEVFGDMLGRGIAPSLSSYNSVIDSCARGEQMCLVPGFIDDMRARGLQPDIITYSAAIKGHSMQGQMSRAIETLVQLRSEPSIKPDEILYNTLIDGCCHARLFDEGEKLFEEMLADGLTPNNYTIACMVRLFGIGRHLSKAFAIFEAGISKYHLRPSGQVYTALIIACAVSKEVDRAVSTYERSVRERAWPAVKACHALIRALLSAGYFVKAVELLRCMLGIAGVYTDDGIIPANPAFISNVLYQLRAESAEGRALAASLSADLQCLPTVPSTDGSGCGGKGRSGYASKGKYVNCKSGSSGAENWRKGR